MAITTLMPKEQAMIIHDSPTIEPRLGWSNGVWLSWLSLAFLLLTICSLLAGLTLAICGLDQTWLHLRNITGTENQRRRALVVIRMKRHATWLLCSLIIGSVACGVSLPLIIEKKLWPYPDQVWASILISTFSMAIFAEILPQYVIPRQAIAWGYYCWPLIWGSMFLTAIISFPLAWLLDHLPTTKDDLGVFTNDQLAVIIKHHDRSEKHGGVLGQDAIRVMLGALKLDNRTIGGNTISTPDQSANKHDKDIERGEAAGIPETTVKWSAVKTVDINDTVDEEFMRMITSWSYTRIPVIGKHEMGANRPEHWKGTEIFGFLHIKNLIGVHTGKGDDRGHARLLVKDLPLNPLPIVNNDMSIYELLNMFQLGISRMAIVVAHPSSDYIDYTYPSPNVATSLSCLRIPPWMPSRISKIRVKMPTGRLGVNDDWTVDYLKAARANAQGPKPQTLGIRSPQPIGIVTFSDLIGTLLQKTSRSESGFFDCSTTVLAKNDRIIDYVMERSRETIEEGGRGPTESERTNKKESIARSDTGQASSQDLTQKGTMRRRNISKIIKPNALDVAAERTASGICGSSLNQHLLRIGSRESSYTQNSEGGFHGSNKHGRSLDSIVLPAYDGSKDITDTCLSNDIYIPDSVAKARASSLPGHVSQTRPLAESSEYPRRYYSAAPRVPSLRRVTPFSKHSYSSYERVASLESQGLLEAANLVEDDVSENEESQSNSNESLGSNEIRETTGEAVTATPSSKYADANVDEGYHDEIYNAPLAISTSSDNVIVPSPIESNQGTLKHCSMQYYDGFATDSNCNKENNIPTYASKTLPRMEGVKNTAVTPEGMSDGDSDDPNRKALLQPTRKVPHINTNFEAGRSSSLWY